MNKLFSPWWLLLLAVAGAVGLALVYANVWSLPIHGNGEKLGQMGDFFGGLLNPLVSLLTLIVAISVWQLQREELKLTRDELEQTKLAMKDQAKTAEQQRQEQRFFDLLNVYYRTVDAVSYAHVTLKGRDFVKTDHAGKAALTAWLGNAPTLFHFALNRGDAVPGQGYTPNSTEIQNMDRMIVQWTGNDALNHFGSYFRVIRHLLTEAEELLGEQHDRYIALFRSQLSRSELVLLAYHLWLDPDSEQTLRLAKSYALLTDLPLGDLKTELESEFGSLLFGALSSERQMILASSDPGSPEAGRDASEDLQLHA